MGHALEPCASIESHCDIFIFLPCQAKRPSCRSIIRLALRPLVSTNLQQTRYQPGMTLCGASNGQQLGIQASLADKFLTHV